ncbi:hypothetical protein BJ742DRAFT_766796 [Cladochytrium replicatum]|nr:hypothetical protein BJ742DRAFT_766796 [Cladochytrium replicatum]
MLIYSYAYRNSVFTTKRVAAGDEEAAFATHSGIGIFNYSNPKPEIRHILAGPTRSIAFAPFEPSGEGTTQILSWVVDPSIAFNLSAQNIIAKAAGNEIRIYDISGTGNQDFNLEAGDRNYSVRSASWTPRKGITPALTAPLTHLPRLLLPSSNPSSPPAPTKASLRNLSFSHHPVDSIPLVVNESWISVAISRWPCRDFQCEDLWSSPAAYPVLRVQFQRARLLLRFVATFGGVDGRLRAVRLPEEGLKEDSSETESIVSAHPSRANRGRFHPKIKNLVVTASQGGGG